MSKACCGGCFSGFRSRKPEILPDRSPQSRGARVSTMEEAFALERPGAGTWIPSPQATAMTRQSSGTSQFASPVPRTKSWDAGTPAAHLDVDFDIVIDEADVARPAVQIDSDIPSSRLGEGRKQNRSRSKFEVEQLVASPGSLPRPMTSHERENIIRSIMPTATFQMLAKLPPDLLQGQTGETQGLRRQLARGSTIVFISAGLPGKKFTFQRAAELGIKSVVIEHPDSWSASMVDEGIIAKFLPLDMSQSSDAIFQQALEIIQALGEDGRTGRVDGICTFVELSVPLVARLCEALGLPGHRASAVDSARNKHTTRACLKAAGLPTPRNALITCEAEAAAAGQHVGFPAVLKPVSGAASLGVKKVSSAHEMLACYKEIVAELSTLVISSGALIKGTGAPGGIDASQSVDLTVLMEQYLDGSEVDIDVIMSEGEWRYAAVADNGPTLEPYFNETWAVCPSLLPKDRQVALKELAVGSVKALGFDSGVFHVECKDTSTGPQLIEVNARMGGGQVRECNLLAWGVDLVEETLFASLGIPAGPMVPKRPLSGVAYCYVNANRSGTVGDMSGLQSLQGRSGVVWAKPLAATGTRAVGPQDGLPTWLCDLLVTAPTAQEALKFLHALEDEEPVKIV